MVNFCFFHNSLSFPCPARYNLSNPEQTRLGEATAEGLTRVPFVNARSCVRTIDSERSPPLSASIIDLIELSLFTIKAECVHAMLIVGKPTVQDTRPSSVFLVGFGTFREKIAGLFIPQVLFKHYVPIIFPKLIERI